MPKGRIGQARWGSWAGVPGLPKPGRLEYNTPLNSERRMTSSGMADAPFWHAKRLENMTAEEWESLCDGCAKCCLVKLEDMDTGAIDHTDVACCLLDPGTCRCQDYGHRQARVPDCVVLRPDTLAGIHWMPMTCAYHRLSEGKDLPWWHHLVSGGRETVHEAGMSVRGRVISEADVADEDLPDRIVDWPLGGAES